MKLRNVRNYILLPASVLLLLAALAVWGYQQQQQPATAALDDSPAAAPALPAGQAAGYPYDVIQVSGTGTATGTPDLAHISLSVSATDDTVAAARSAAAVSLQNVLDALRNSGIAAADIATSHFNVHPDYDWSQGERRFRGYVVSSGLDVTLRDTGAVGSVIDAAIAAGGNQIAFDSLRFSFANTGTMAERARQSAVADMQNKAAQLARFSGRQLGNLKLISETPPAASYPLSSLARLESAGMSADAGTPIAVGEDEIAVTVYGVYELR